MMRRKTAFAVVAGLVAALLVWPGSARAADHAYLLLSDSGRLYGATELTAPTQISCSAGTCDLTVVGSPLPANDNSTGGVFTDLTFVNEQQGSYTLIEYARATVKSATVGNTTEFIAPDSPTLVEGCALTPSGQTRGDCVLPPTGVDLQISTSPTVGEPVSVTATIRDVLGQQVRGYHRTVQTSSSDGKATLPGNYTFTAADEGQHTFDGVVFGTAGAQTLTMSDTVQNFPWGQTDAQVAAAVTAPADLWVTTGGTDTGTCPQANPCATLGFAATVAATTATVHMGPGTFDEEWTTPSDKSLTVIGDPGGTTVTSGGDAIDVFGGSLTLDGLTLSAGLYAIAQLGGTLTVSDSTLAGSGDGVSMSGGTLHLDSSTIANNSDTGLYLTGGSAVVTDSTIAGNGGTGGFGAVYTSAPITLRATLIAGNFGGPCPGPVSVTDGGENLSDGPCDFTDPSSRQSVANLHVGPLASNGGPTQTVAPASDSVAVDAIPSGSALCTGTDQRGIARPQSGGCDVGAVELAPSDTTLTASTATPSPGEHVTLSATVTGSFDLPAPQGSVTFTSGGNTLCADVALAGAIATCDITAPASGSEQVKAVYVGTNGYLGSSHNATITVAAPAELYVTTGGTDTGGCPQASPCATLGYASSVAASTATIHMGPGTFVSQYTAPADKTLTVIGDGTTLTYPDVGAAVTVKGGELDLVDIGVAGSGATGVMQTGGVLVVRDTTIANNAGDGILEQGGQLRVANSTVAGNHVAGIAQSDGTLTVRLSTLAENQINLFASSATLTGTVLAAASVANCLGDGGAAPPTDDGFNYADDASCKFTAAGSVNSATQLQLGPLADNGGPTQTIAPRSDSQLYAAIPPSVDWCSGADQRGVPRPQNVNCEPGAVELAPSATAITADKSSADVGTPVTFTATVTGSLGMPTPAGTVTFVSDTGTACYAVPLVAGVATCTTSNLRIGSVGVTAFYAATNGYVGSGDTVDVVVNAVAPVVTTQPADQTVTVGGDATFTAAASGNPTPIVQWQSSTDGGGTWTNVSGPTSGTLKLTAVPLADSGNQYRAVFTNIGGSATTRAATLTVNPGPLASLTLDPATATTVAGTGVTYTAHGFDAFGDPLGDVTAGTTFAIGPDGSCAGATCTPAAPGSHTVTGTNAGVTGTASLTALAPTVITSGDAATFTVGRAGSFPVTAVDVSTFAISGAPSWLSIDATSGLLTGTPPPGSAGSYPFTITATGPGGIANQSFTLTVVRDTATLDVTVTPDPPVAGQPLTVTVQVTPADAGGPTPTGDVTVADPVTAVLHNGTASVTLTGLRAGPLPVTVHYSGDPTYAPAMTVRELTVQAAPGSPSSAPPPTTPATTTPGLGSPGGGAVAVTGAQVVTLWQLAGLLLIAGAALSLVGRRRARRVH